MSRTIEQCEKGIKRCDEYIALWLKDKEDFEKELKELKGPKHGDIVEYDSVGKRIIIKVDGKFVAYNDHGERKSTYVKDHYNKGDYRVIGNVFTN